MGALGRIFRAPWLATIRSANGYLFLLVWFALAVGITKPMAIHGPMARVGIPLLALAVATAWKLAINALWLARDARALRLPGIEADINVLPLMFAIATIVLPTLLLGLVFGHALWWLLGLALVASAVVALCVLPLIIATPMFVVIAGLLLFGIHPPLPGAVGFLRWAIPTAIALVLIAAERWHTLMGATTITANGWWRPATLGGRRLRVQRLSGGSYSSPQPVGVHTGRKVTRSALRDIGPAHPIRSTRSALGRGTLPFDTRVDPRHYWRWRVALAVAVVLPAIGALITQRAIGVATIRNFAPQWLLIAAIMLTASALHDRATDQAWCGPRADLFVPALLPGLGPPTRIHRDTLIACMTGTFNGRLACTVSGVLLFAVLHLPPMFYVYLLLMAATGTAMHLATTTGSLCGRAHRLLISYATYGIVTLGAAVATVNWGVRIIDGPSVQILTPALPTLACVATWIACCAGCCAIAWCNWRRFIRKPHPFLPNAVD